MVVAGGLDSGVTSSAGKGDVHGLVEQLETLDLLDSLDGRLGLLEDDESLPFGLQVGLGDDVDDVAVLGEDGSQGGFQNIGLDALFKIAHIDATWIGQTRSQSATERIRRSIRK